MTGDNRRQNIADEVARADQSIRAADALVALGLHADAVSRVADYDAAVRFSGDDSAAEVKEARSFIDVGLAFLAKDGWLGTTG